MMQREREREDGSKRINVVEPDDLRLESKALNNIFTLLSLLCYNEPNVGYIEEYIRFSIVTLKPQLTLALQNHSSPCYLQSNDLHTYNNILIYNILTY